MLGDGRGKGLYKFAPWLRIMELGTCFGWSNGSFTKRHRKKAMISILAAVRKFFGPNKFSRLQCPHLKTSTSRMILTTCPLL